MGAELRKVGEHDHLCLIFDSEEEQAAAFVPFLQAGLVQNELCIYLVDQSDPDWVMAQMSRNGFPVEKYAAKGAFKIVATTDAYLKDGYFDTEKIMSYWADEIRTALAAGYVCVRATGEMSWALRDFPGCDRLIEYECHVNSVLPHANMIGLCQYDRRRFDAGFVKKVIHTHPFVCVSRQVIKNPGFIEPEAYIESNVEIELRALVDNLLMTKQLSDANERLQEALQQQVQSNQLLEQRQREYEDLYHELISLARVMSHEMQAPLTSMQRYLRLLAARYADRLGADADEFIMKSLSESKLLMRMIDDLWNYARVDAPAESVIEELDVMHVLGDVINDLTPLIDANRATVDHQQRFTKIRIARRHLEFLLKSIIENAIKYRCEDKAPQVFVSQRDASDSVCFSVRDNGRGIDPVHSAEIFKLFGRLNEPLSEDGTGMGLAICKRIVQYYGGKIWFESEQGAGSTFHFVLPQTAPKTNVQSMQEFRDRRQTT